MTSRLKKRLVRWPLYVVVLLVVLYLAVLPAIVTYWGRGYLADKLSQLTQSQVTIGSLYFDPFSWEISLNQLAISRQDHSIIAFDKLQADISALPLLSHQVYLRRLALVAPTIHIVRLSDGKTLNLQSLVPKQKNTESKKTEKQKSVQWSIRLVDVWLNNGQVTFSDKSVAEKPTRRISHIDLHLHDVTLEKQQPFDFDLSLVLPSSAGQQKTAPAPGKLTISGELGLVPLQLEADVQLTSLRLPEGNPWLQNFVKGKLTSGRVNAQAEVQLEPDKALKVKGEASVQQLVFQNASDEPLLQFESLEAQGIKLNSAQREVAVNLVTMTGLEGQFSLFDGGENTLSRLLVVPEKGATSTSGQPKQSSPEDSEKPTDKPWHLHIGETRISAKHLVFNDQSVKPHFQLAAQPLQLTLGELDNQDKAPVAVALKAKLDGYAPLQVGGNLGLFGKALSVDLTTHLKRYDMTQLTPYVAPIVGYKVKRGHLDVDSKLALKGTQIDSQNTIRALDFHLGSEVPSKQALNVPVKFGLTVLRDGDGNISLPLNMAGDLSDPSVNIHGLVVDTLLNVLKKAALSPFSLLSGLYGTDLSQVEFATAASKPSVDALQPVAELLADKPSLQLGVSGRTNKADAKAMTAEGLSGDELEAALLELAKARAKAFRDILADHYDVAAERVHIEKPQTGAEVSGVILSLFK